VEFLDEIFELNIKEEIKKKNKDVEKILNQK
jgi:hypothetical protein